MTLEAPPSAAAIFSLYLKNKTYCVMNTISGHKAHEISNSSPNIDFTTINATQNITTVKV